MFLLLQVEKKHEVQRDVQHTKTEPKFYYEPVCGIKQQAHIVRDIELCNMKFYIQ